MLKRLKNRGDTIVEVMLAVAVVSAVLGGAYVATNSSLKNVRNSQERGEALKLVQGQLEKLKEASRTSNAVYTTSTNPFCLTDTLTPTNAPATCTQGRYNLTIQRTPDAGGFTFTAGATWTPVSGGTTTNRMNIKYRTYQ